MNPDSLPLDVPPDPETRRLALEASEAIKAADIPRLERLIVELEERYGLASPWQQEAAVVSGISKGAVCAHGLIGFCPACPPDRHTIGDTRGVRATRVRGREVWRYKEDGSLDWVTTHFTKRGARRAAELYERTGKVKGRRP